MPVSGVCLVRSSIVDGVQAYACFRGVPGVELYSRSGGTIYFLLDLQVLRHAG